jgi:DNA polymerase
MSALREAVPGCRGCPLYANATQAVFGEGTHESEVMLVGEQPGDQEDSAGTPFVGPAGKLLDRALDEAGIDRRTATSRTRSSTSSGSARGKRRIHDKPRWTEIGACRPWLEAELAVVKPRALVLMGATAGQSAARQELPRHAGIAGSRSIRRSRRDRVATIHPSAVLRGEDATRSSPGSSTTCASSRRISSARRQRGERLRRARRSFRRRRAHRPPCEREASASRVRIQGQARRQAAEAAPAPTSSTAAPRRTRT